MSQKQEKYWENIIHYIRATEDCILDHHMAGEYAEEEAAIKKRMKHLTDNYVLSRKPQKSAANLFAAFIGRKPKA